MLSISGAYFNGEIPSAFPFVHALTYFLYRMLDEMDVSKRVALETAHLLECCSTMAATASLLAYKTSCFKKQSALAKMLSLLSA